MSPYDRYRGECVGTAARRMYASSVAAERHQGSSVRGHLTSSVRCFHGFASVCVFDEVSVCCLWLDCVPLRDLWSKFGGHKYHHPGTPGHSSLS